MIYLDNAATSFPKPEAVFTKVSEAVKIYGGNPGRGGCPPSSLTAEAVYSCRETVNAFFNGYGAEYVVFTSNATSALNAAIFGTAKKHRSGHIVITSFEHNSVLRPVEELRKSQGIEYTVVNPSLFDDSVTVSRILSAVRKDTFAVIVTHASNVCGLILPVEKIGNALKKRDVTYIVDASQSAGVEKIDIKKANIDILCLAGHKGLMGITGTGLMLLNKDKLPVPTVFGGTGSNSAEAEMPLSSPERFESGTLNTVGILSVEEGIKVLKTHPDSSLREKKLARRLYLGLKGMKNVKLVAPFEISRYVPTVSFNVRGLRSFETSEKLGEMGFATRGGLHCAPLTHKYFGTFPDGLTRVSIGFFNTEKEIDKFLSAVEEISAKN